MRIETITVTLPSHWASALVNGDYSGMTTEECMELNNWRDANKNLGPCWDCSEQSFTARLNGLLTDCLEYTFPIKD